MSKEEVLAKLYEGAMQRDVNGFKSKDGKMNPILLKSIFFKDDSSLCILTFSVGDSEFDLQILPSTNHTLEYTLYSPDETLLSKDLGVCIDFAADQFLKPQE